MAYFPFSGWKDSFFGILHGQGRDAVEFYTEKKVVVERRAKDIHASSNLVFSLVNPCVFVVDAFEDV